MPAFFQARSMTEFLSHRIGRSDAFSFSVARSADAADHGVDLVSVALGIRQALQHEDRCAFAHDESIGSFGVGAGAGCGERADLAELHEGLSSHVAINAAGDHDVKIVHHKSFDCGAHRGHRRCARRVANVVWTVEVVDVRDASGNAVGQFAGHAVFRDFGEMLANPVVQFAGNVAADRFRQSGESWRSPRVRARIQESKPASAVR